MTRKISLRNIKEQGTLESYHFNNVIEVLTSLIQNNRSRETNGRLELV
jgi:hypothetical protein